MSKTISLPKAFINHIANILPKHLNIDDFIAACSRPLRRSIRVNTLTISVPDFKQRVESKGWVLTSVPWCNTGFWLQRPADENTPLGNTAEHLAGLFYIQEASSMMPVTALTTDNQQLGVVLDVASAPGSKTTQLSAEMMNQGLLVANEYSASRIKVLSANVKRCGVRNVALTHFDGRVFGRWLPETFDSILLDAPCSGEGTIRKDPDAMKNWSLGAIEEIGSTQRELIESAFHALKPNGVLVYSTCTLSHQENQDICHHLKHTFGDAVQFESLHNLFDGADKACTEEGFLHIFPQIFDCEGFFVARIRKTASVPRLSVKKKLGKFPFNKASEKECLQLSDALSQTLQLQLPKQHSVWLRDSEVWLFPIAIEPLLKEIRFQRIGIKLADQHKKGYKWQHEAIIALTDTSSSTNSVEISSEMAKEWYMCRDIRPEAVGKGEVIVSYNGDVIGIGKWVGNRIKNGYPRELVKDTNLFDC